MKKIARDLIKLFAGYFVYAIGIVMTINANLGLAPWDVFHQGLSNTLSITIGKVYIITGLAIILVDGILGEKIGWGTVFNMIFIGLFIDLIMMTKIIPVFNRFIPGVVIMLIGMLILSFGCYLYMSVGLGSGPRDGLLIALVKKSNRSVRFVKSSMDLLVVTIGYMLRGHVGIGTLIMAVLGGYFLQFAFKIMKFQAKDIQHRFIYDDINYLKMKIAGEKSDAND